MTLFVMRRSREGASRETATLRGRRRYAEGGGASAKRMKQGREGKAMSSSLLRSVWAAEGDDAGAGGGSARERARAEGDGAGAGGGSARERARAEGDDAGAGGGSARERAKAAGRRQRLGAGEGSDGGAPAC